MALDAMVRPVQYARGLDGKLVAVEQGPHSGFAIGDQVYASREEANREAGRINQRCYIEEQTSEARVGLWLLVTDEGPFDEWREKYDTCERTSDLVDGLINSLFPKYGKRSEYAQRFADAFIAANAVHEEMVAHD